MAYFDHDRGTWIRRMVGGDDSDTEYEDPAREAADPRHRRKAARLNLGNKAVDALAIVAAHDRGKFAPEAHYLPQVSHELRYDSAHPPQRGTPADLVHHGLRLGGDAKFWDDTRKKHSEYVKYFRDLQSGRYANAPNALGFLAQVRDRKDPAHAERPSADIVRMIEGGYSHHDIDLTHRHPEVVRALANTGKHDVHAIIDVDEDLSALAIRIADLDARGARLLLELGASMDDPGVGRTIRNGLHSEDLHTRIKTSKLVDMMRGDIPWADLE